MQYNFQAISIALIVMSSSVCTSDADSCADGEQSAWVSSTATATVFMGAIAGQLSVRNALQFVRFLYWFLILRMVRNRWAMLATFLAETMP